MKVTPDHTCRVFGSPWADVYCTDINSARHYGKHWHATYGLGLLESGAQSSASGRGQVEALAGNLITTNPGEVHDGRPMGGASRRWRMVYLEPAVISSMLGDPQSCAVADVELARPVIEDERLSVALREFFRRAENGGGQQLTNTHVLAVRRIAGTDLRALVELPFDNATCPGNRR